MLPVLFRTGSTALSKSIIPSFLNFGFLIAIAGGAYLLLKKVIGSIRRGSAIANYGAGTTNGLAVRYASQFYNAMVRSWEWWSDLLGDGTNFEVIISTAAEMHRNGVTFQDVSRQYQALYGRDLVQHLTSELDADQMGQFHRVLSGGLSGIAVSDSFLTTNKPTWIFDAEFSPVRQVPARTRLGEHTETYLLATGQSYHGFEYQGKMRYVQDAAVIRTKK